MARPDWGAIQKKFLADHDKTNISPRNWCEAQGINYATARRYIKKSVQNDVPEIAQNAQNAQRKLRTAQSTQIDVRADELINNEEITPMQALFIIEYIKDKNATQAAVRAGYSENTAGQIGYQLRQKTSIAQAIDHQLKAAATRQLITADSIIARMWEMATVDVNNLVEYRRECCRYCWGKNHGYQWTKDEYNKARVATEENDIAGGFGFKPFRPPHPECPNCDGEGHGSVHIHDTRKLPLAALSAYEGVKVTKEGVQVLIADRGKMLENVARHLGLLKDKVEMSGPDGGSIQTSDISDEELEQRLREFGYGRNTDQLDKKQADT